ncbi:MAG: Rne/Rng family ribonuclease [Deltaproteobacteria bacterium]|nr:Rne/Rng family ribonuclease [Deltaproteobacteria bacterium]
MSKQLVINASATEEIRVAIIEDGRLVDLDIDSSSRTKQKGNIYKGIVANVEDSLEAAFIEFGDEKQAFLALSEVRPALYPPELRGQRRPKISEVLKRGQELVVQITKDEMGTKGAAVTTYLSLPGRYVVLMHSDDSGGGVSRKIEDEAARRRARDMLGHLEVPDGQAVIIRTAGMNRPMIDLYRDLKALAKVWEQIDRGGQLGRAPTLLYREPDLVVRTVRDYLAPDIGKIVIDAEDEFEELKSYFEERSPDSLSLLERYEGRQPLFEKLGIEGAIEELFERQVRLPAGGYLIIDQTEALVAIDVNSGKSTRESDHEATVYKTNLEAAREVARQLRLRDLGGIIVVDFIDMMNRRHDRDVERALRDAMRDDKARVKISRISENGTLEITRQRLRQAHRLVSHTPCPHCAGTGVVRDPKGLAVSALRQLTNRLSKSAHQLARLTVRVPVDVANLINTMKRRDLLDMSEEHQCLVDVQADVRLQGSEIRYDEERRGRAGLDAAQQIRDPRLVDGERGRRRRRRDESSSAFAGQTLGPPPSIGPVPRFLADEETILAADQRLAEDEAHAAEARAKEIEEGGERRDEHAPPSREREREHFARAPAPPAVEHFDDPLTEALFGSAPDMAITEAEGPPDAALPAAAEGEDGAPRKRRRRRRRRRGSNGGDSAATPGAESAAGAEPDDGGDDSADEDDGDANERDGNGGDAAEARDDEGADEGGGGTEDQGAGAPPAAGAPADDEQRRRRRRSRRGGRGRRRAGEAPAAAPLAQSAAPPDPPEA